MRWFRRGVLSLLAVLCLLLAGCADQTHEAVIEAVISKGDDTPPAEDVPPAEDPAAPGESPAPEEENLFERIPRSYLFCSGAGGWSTELTLEADGSFAGMYHDSDMGDLDEARYPNGTVYLCRFRGEFARPEAVDETTWTMRIESLELDHPAGQSEEIEDGIRYVYTEPFGLEDTEALTVYLPDTLAEGLDENILWAARGPYDWKPTEAGTLGVTILYNAAQDHGFVQYPYGGV